MLVNANAALLSQLAKLDAAIKIPIGINFPLKVDSVDKGNAVIIIKGQKIEVDIAKLPNLSRDNFVKILSKNPLKVEIISKDSAIKQLAKKITESIDDAPKPLLDALKATTDTIRSDSQQQSLQYTYTEIGKSSGLIIHDEEKRNKGFMKIEGEYLNGVVEFDTLGAIAIKVGNDTVHLKVVDDHYLYVLKESPSKWQITKK